MTRHETHVEDRYGTFPCPSVTRVAIFLSVINTAWSLLITVGSLVALGYTRHQNSNNIHIGHRSTTRSLEIIWYSMSSTASLMLLYGVIKPWPSFLLPMLAVQLCDFSFSFVVFLISLNVATNSTSCGTALNCEDDELSWRNSNLQPIPFFLVILFKGFFLGVIWKCYRNLRIKEFFSPVYLSQTTDCPPSPLPPSYRAIIDATTSNPPDYEWAIKYNSGSNDLID